MLSNGIERPRLMPLIWWREIYSSIGNEFPIGQRNVVDVAVAGGKPVAAIGAVVAEGDARQVAPRLARQNRAGQTDEGLLALALDDDVERRTAQHQLRHRGAVFAAEHKQGVGKARPDMRGEIPRQRPQRAEHAADADDAGIRRNALGDLVEREALQHEIGAQRIGYDGVERRAGAVDHGVAKSGIFQSARNIRQAQRRTGHVHLQAGECLQPGRIDERDHSLILRNLRKTHIMVQTSGKAAGCNPEIGLLSPRRFCRQLAQSGGLNGRLAEMLSADLVDSLLKTCRFFGSHK